MRTEIKLIPKILKLFLWVLSENERKKSNVELDIPRKVKDKIKR